MSMSLNNDEAAAQLQIAIYVNRFAITDGPGSIYNVNAISVILHLQKINTYEEIQNMLLYQPVYIKLFHMCQQTIAVCGKICIIATRRLTQNTTLRCSKCKTLRKKAHS